MDACAEGTFTKGVNARRRGGFLLSDVPVLTKFGLARRPENALLREVAMTYMATYRPAY